MKRNPMLFALLAILSVAATTAPTSDNPNNTLDNLEFTGFYVIRHIRVPSEGDKPAKLLRFQVPVFREHQATKTLIPTIIEVPGTKSN